jgi:hypothetical protein
MFANTKLKHVSLCVLTTVSKRLISTETMEERTKIILLVAFGIVAGFIVTITCA